MAAKRADFTMFSGEHRVLEIAIVDADGDAVDLTGATVEWRLARSARGTPVISKTTVDSGGVEITGAEAGLAEVTLVGADTEALEGDYYHEARVVDSGDRPATVLYGTATIKPNLIRDED